MFYLRPGNLYKDFVIEPHIAEKSTTGRATAKYAQRGRPKAKAGDRLLLENRAYYVEGVDPLGDLGLYTLYYVQQREDTHNGN